MNNPNNKMDSTIIIVFFIVSCFLNVSKKTVRSSTADNHSGDNCRMASFKAVSNEIPESSCASM